MKKANEQLLAVADQQAGLIQSYSHRYQSAELMLTALNDELDSTKQLYQENESVLKGVSSELKVTQAILNETEKWVSQVKNKGDANLANQLESLTNTSPMELSSSIAMLRNKNDQLAQDTRFFRAYMIH